MADSDALFHEYSAEGRRHMKYVADRGSFADLPFEEIMSAFAALYGRCLGGCRPRPR